MNFCICGSLKVNNNCTNKHCSEKNNKNKDWVVEGVALDFKKPVSHEEAVRAAKILKESKDKGMKL